MRMHGGPIVLRIWGNSASPSWGYYVERPAKASEFALLLVLDMVGEVLDAQLWTVTLVSRVYPVRAVTDLLDLTSIAGVRHFTRLIRKEDSRVILLSQVLLWLGR